jgi:hypothetical protein
MVDGTNVVKESANPEFDPIGVYSCSILFRLLQVTVTKLRCYDSNCSR